jgi:FkbM family methyltransferase
MLTSKIRTLTRWYRELSGPSSLYGAIKLHRMGRDADPATDVTRTIRVRGLDLALHCRPGTADFITFLELFVGGEYRAAPCLVDGDVRWILDLGGNVGLASAYFHRLWPGARFVVVEPDPHNARTAGKTLAPLVSRGQAFVHRGFIGGTERVARIERSGARGSNEFRLGADSTAGGPGQEAGPISSDETAPVMTVPSLLRAHDVPRIDLLKCDIEGAEGELFENCREWINKVRFIVAELHDGRTANWLVEQIARNGGRAEVLVDEAKSTPGISVVWLKCDAGA